MRKKTFQIILIVLLALFIIISILYRASISLGNILFLNGKENIHSENILYNHVIEDSFSGINIDVIADEIKIIEAEDEVVKIKIYGEIEDKIDVSVQNNILNISHKQKECKLFCFNNKIGKIELYLPSYLENKIDIKNTYGDITMDGFDNIDLNVNADYGNLKIQSIKSLSVNSDYGNVELGQVYSYINLRLNYGNVYIQDLLIKQNSNISTDFGNIVIKNSNDIYVDAKTNLGNVKILNNGQSNIILHTYSNLGNIEINN